MILAAQRFLLFRVGPSLFALGLFSHAPVAAAGVSSLQLKQVRQQEEEQRELAVEAEVRR